MKSTTLELFWVEKIKLTQNTINLTKGLTDSQLDFPDDLALPSIRKSLHAMVSNDRRFANYLPFSLKMSGLFRFSPASQDEIERELTKIRDLFNPPALPPKLSEIIIRDPGNIDLSDTNSSLLPLFKSWVGVLNSIEKAIENLSEEDAICLRYFSLSGIYVIPAAINMTAMQNHFLLKDGILRFLNDKKFPKV
ncbi:hypothetical protein [Leptospira sp. GIMC2001]|uniref:hypothetical protein n=1 Tax=Leptospira sp. GIMC2001 TaxID=1513297 RepID=UPI00234AB839|nr:hypothetical protein [Leptospira sp. GIMC2001]WCL50206.1 hypothetical protein O4O04_05135 [Leptospira sp. GIMC2001]